MIVACHDFKNIAGFNEALQKDISEGGGDEFDYLKSLGKKIAEHAKETCFDEEDGRITTFLLPSKSLLDLIRASQIDVERFNSPEFKNISDVVTAAAAADGAAAAAAAAGGGGRRDAAAAGLGAAHAPAGGGPGGGAGGVDVADGADGGAAAAPAAVAGAADVAAAAAARADKIREDFRDDAKFNETFYKYRLAIARDILKGGNDDQKLNKLKNLFEIYIDPSTPKANQKGKLITDFIDSGFPAPDINGITPLSPRNLRTFANVILRDITATPDIKIRALDSHIKELTSFQSEANIPNNDAFNFYRGLIRDGTPELEKLQNIATEFLNGFTSPGDTTTFESAYNTVVSPAPAAAAHAPAAAPAPAGGGAGPAPVPVPVPVTTTPAAVAIGLAHTVPVATAGGGGAGH